MRLFSSFSTRYNLKDPAGLGLRFFVRRLRAGIKVRLRDPGSEWRVLKTDELWIQLDFLFLFWDWQPGFSIEL